MKGLKKIALVTAVAAAPFAANAELQALDEASMSNVTGQAGVTIELETRVGIGEFVYTDEGSFAVKDIEIGGEGVGGGDASKDTLNNLALEIDVADDGDAVIHVTTTESAEIAPGVFAAVPIDFGVSTGDMELRSSDGNNTTVLLSNLSMHGDLAALDIRVDTTGDGDGTASNPGIGVEDSLSITAAFDVDNLDVDVPFLAVGIRGMVITGADGTPSATPNEGTGKDFASVRLDVYKGTAQGAIEKNADGTVASRDNADGEALVIGISDLTMDVYIGDVQIGGDIAGGSGRSIGSVALDNLSITNTKLAVYGH